MSTGGKSAVALHHQVRRRKGLKRPRKKLGESAGPAQFDLILSPKDVQEWLQSLNLPEVGKTAKRRGVSGLALPHLGHAGWEELGISSAVDRAIIMGHAAELQASHKRHENKSTGETKASGHVPQTSHWNRLKQFVWKNDLMIPADHKRVWFEKMARSGKAPEEIKESLSQQMDSYNLLTLLLLATVIPTATGICDEMRWDEEGWPLSRTRFAYLVFSAWFSFCLYVHFGFSHMASVMFGDVSNANLKYFMESIGIGFLTELGSLFALNFFSFFVWVIFTMIALISENAHWVVWLISSLGIGFAAWFAVHFVATVMARSGLDSHLLSAPYYLRLEVHSGLFSNEGLQLDSDLSRKSLLEKLSERAMQDLEGTKNVQSRSNESSTNGTNTSHVDHDSDPGDSEEDSEKAGSDDERPSEMALEVAV